MATPGISSTAPGSTGTGPRMAPATVRTQPTVSRVQRPNRERPDAAPAVGMRLAGRLEAAQRLVGEMTHVDQTRVTFETDAGGAPWLPFEPDLDGRSAPRAQRDRRTRLAARRQRQSRRDASRAARQGLALDPALVTPDGERSGRQRRHEIHVGPLRPEAWMMTQGGAGGADRSLGRALLDRHEVRHPGVDERSAPRSRQRLDRHLLEATRVA